MAPFQLPLVTLNANESAFLTPIYQEIRQVYIRIGKHAWPVISTVVSILKGFSVRQAVT